MRLSDANMRAPRLWSISAGVIAVFATPAAAQLPYNPTRILLSRQNDTLAYVFRPSQTEGDFALSALDLSTQFDLDDVPYEDLFPSLPFLQAGKPLAFTPVIDHAGNIVVYAGDCANGAAGSDLWRYTPAPFPQDTGSWEKEVTTRAGLVGREQMTGSNYLAAGFAFSSEIDGDGSDSDIYMFGGMCPSADSTLDTWTTSANYSDMVLSFQAQSLHGFYQGLPSSEITPIPEAGSTITPLGSTYISSGGQSLSQQQNFVMIGGHTETAFLNMSQIALFSLPEETWTFIDVEAPTQSHTDLSVRKDVSEVQPRSGHTAVLTPDAGKIIVFGGWVGDVDTPAEPQLAILQVGEGYGGNGEWSWVTPSTPGPDGPSEDFGIYGHGAAMLSNGIMMILGGSTMPPSSKRLRGRETASENTRALFFDTNSNSWLTEYSPADLPDGSYTHSSQSSDGALSSASEQAGLAVGLVIGIASVAGLVLFYLWYRRRQRRQRATSEKGVHHISRRSERPTSDALGTGGIDGRGGQLSSVNFLSDRERAAYYCQGGPSAESSIGWRSTSGHEAERTGLLVEIPSPTRGLRRSNARGGYQSGHRYRSIHPIDEREEDEQAAADEEALDQPEMTEQKSPRGVLSMNAFQDIEEESEAGPSRQPRRSSSPRFTAEQRAREVKSWVSDWELAAGTLFSPPSTNGRNSPTKSERTISNLSEQSHRSTFSSKSTSTAHTPRSRSSLSAAIVSTIANPFMTPNPSPTHDEALDSPLMTGSPARFHPPFPLLSPGEPDGDAESFMTARSTFAHLQAQGENLLGGARPSTASTSAGDTSPTSSSPHRTGSPSRPTEEEFPNRPATRDRSNSRLSWLPGVRRVLLGRSNTGQSIGSASGERTNASHRHSFGVFSSAGAMGNSPRHSPAPRLIRSQSASPTPPPRRAASDASFWRSQRGARDWGVGQQLAAGAVDERLWQRNSGDDWGAPEDRDRSGARTAMSGSSRPEGAEAEEDWDVEAAVERRVVQVMFTVPRTQLRVVNADAENRSLMSVEERAELVEASRENQEEVERNEGQGKGKGKQRADSAA